jgi:Domain of unknown function (DUF4328)
MGVGARSYVIETTPLDPMGLWRWLYGAVACAMGLICLQIIVEAWDLAFHPYTSAWVIVAWAWYYLYLGVHFATYAVMVFGFLLVMRMTYRFVRNLHALKALGAIPSPTAAVCYYISPILCIYVPGQIMSGVWRATCALNGAAEPDLSGWWWGLWMLSLLLNAWSYLAYERDYAMSVFIGAAGAGSALVAGWLTLRLFGGISRMQSELVAKARVS